jgi:recombinational DNA repair protein (RecF pathway)
MRRVNIIVLRFQDQGVVLRIIPFEEAKYIITVLTKQNGVYQGMTDQSIPVWTHIKGQWSSRTQTLGYWTWEEVSCPHYADYQMLLTLQTLSSLLCHVLPVRHPYPAIYEALLIYKDTTQFADLLFLILDEIGYGVSAPSPVENKVKQALNLFEKHCGWKRVLS